MSDEWGGGGVGRMQGKHPFSLFVSNEKLKQGSISLSGELVMPETLFIFVTSFLYEV